MPLNLSTSSGEYTPYLKYNAKAGRFYVKAEGATEDTEIVQPLLAFDMATIRTGWVLFQQDGPPQKVWDPSLQQMADKPSDGRQWKRGFEVMVFSNAMIPRTTQKIGLREFCATAATVVGPIVRMYEEYEKTGGNGKVPVYACTGVAPVESKFGTNYEPLFELKQWVERSKVPEFASRHESSEEPAAMRTMVKSPPKITPKAMFDERNPPPNMPTVRRSLEDEMSDEVPF